MSSTSELNSQRLQADEFLALTHIYLSEFTPLHSTFPHKFSILCKPYIGNQFEYQLSITFEMGRGYPCGNGLKWEIQPLAGITRDNLNQIGKKIDEIVISSAGKPIVFDIVEETRTWIHEYLVEGKQTEEEISSKPKDEVFQRPKFAAFTPVTIQNFLAWKKQFQARHKVVKVQKKEGQVKISGKQWFLGKHDQDVQEEQDDQDQDQEQIQGDEEEKEEKDITQEEKDPINELFNQK